MASRIFICLVKCRSRQSTDQVDRGDQKGQAKKQKSSRFFVTSRLERLLTGLIMDMPHGVKRRRGWEGATEDEMNSRLESTTRLSVGGKIDLEQTKKLTTLIMSRDPDLQTEEAPNFT